ncbi:hypothetical protein CKO51_09400 [Rhodopirellula sp. SM50]|nr:hypothetical protein [Rhodopirellula sp. SM50]PAY19810.1 hypothetical protein CKO51_09400 [Rhodopirellula sp. SM50]
MTEGATSCELVVDAWQADQKVARGSQEIQLLHRSNEWLRPQAKPERLQALVEAGGGQMVSSKDDLDALLRSIEIAPGEVLIHQLPLWDHGMLWSLLLSLLAIDWIFRRRGVQHT